MPPHAPFPRRISFFLRLMRSGRPRGWNCLTICAILKKLHKNYQEVVHSVDQSQDKQNNLLLKLARMIVDKRSLIFLLTGIAIVFSLIAAGWVRVENDLTAYLPSGSSTKEGLDVMKRYGLQFYDSLLLVSASIYT